ncbi:MAG: 1-acyl-sn-glycerol-3-phosphate acyltransferase [Janthinobacterium lividum]
MLAAGTWREGHFLPRSGEWLATGDLGIQESSGELRFAGRKGDVLVTAAGLNIYPQDLEAALLAQAGVRGCAVVAGETLRGVEPVAVVLFEGDDAALRRAAAAANATLAAFQQMGYVLRWPEPGFPYTATGKLLRRRIADWACLQIAPSHTGSHAGPDDGKMQDPLLRLIGEITREPVVNPAPTQRLTEDLHLDSLGRVQLQSALEEQFGVEIGEERMASAGTLGELFALLGRDPGLLPLADPPRPDMTGERGQAASLATAASGPSGKERNAASYPRWPWSAPVRWLRAAFVEAVLRPLVWLIAAPRVLRSGEAQLRGPLLLVANHVNTYDVPLILYALPGYLRRHVATAMSAEVLADMRRGRNQGSARWNLLARPASWLLVTLFNVFPLPRLQGFRRSFAHAGEALDRGYSVLLFPEGRRGQTGNLQPFRPGIGLLVQASGVPVLPIALQGMGAAGRRRSGPRQIAVQIGEPIRFASDLSAEEITRRLQAAVRALGPS